MVADPRATLGAGDVRALRPQSGLRPLNAPSPLRVDLDASGRVVALWRQGRLTPRTIAAVQDRWRIDDEWWREHAISRMYYALLLDDGTLLTVYHDLVADAWFEQRS
jgi:hypothetical protein